MSRNQQIAILLASVVGVLVVAKIASNPKSYLPTPNDRLWLLRAVEVEGPPREMVARALVNLFMWLRLNKGYKGTLAALVRSYAQPVNPKWFDTGSLFHQSLAKKTSESERQKAWEKAYRRRTVHSKRLNFSPETIDAVDKALSLGWPSDITDYAAPFVDASRKYERRTESRAGVNTFWSRAPDWTGYQTTPSGELVG